MERTRDEILGLLQVRDLSVAELAAAIGVSEGSIRRHLDLMAADGLIDSRLERQPRGRPVARYSITEAGEEHESSAYYERLLARIFPALGRLTAEQVGGLAGRDLLDRIFDELAAARAREHAGQVRAQRLEDRVEQVTQVLREEGILTEAEAAPDGFHLRNEGCPYRSCAEDHDAACDADRRTIELLLGMPVMQVSTMAGGAAICEYLVPTNASPGIGDRPPLPVV